MRNTFCFQPCPNNTLDEIPGVSHSNDFLYHITVKTSLNLPCIYQRTCNRKCPFLSFMVNFPKRSLKRVVQNQVSSAKFKPKHGNISQTWQQLQMPQMQKKQSNSEIIFKNICKTYKNHCSIKALIYLVKIQPDMHKSHELNQFIHNITTKNALNYCV